MALVYDTFQGINILVPGKRGQRPGTPTTEQVEQYSGIDGGREIFHGRDPREILLTGFAMQVTSAALYTAEALIQEYIGSVGALVHYSGGTSTTYLYCLLKNFFLAGELMWEVGTNYPCSFAYARLRQISW